MYVLASTIMDKRLETDKSENLNRESNNINRFSTKMGSKFSRQFFIHLLLCYLENLALSIISFPEMIKFLTLKTC